MRADRRVVLSTCETCAYSNESESPADESQGGWLLCVRRAPAVLREATDGWPGGPGVFPRVDRTGFCGEWVQCCINTHERNQTDFLVNQLMAFDEDASKESVGELNGGGIPGP